MQVKKKETPKEMDVAKVKESPQKKRAPPVVKKPSFKADIISPLKNAGNMMTTADSIKQPILSPSVFTENKKEELLLTKEKSSDELSTKSSKEKQEAKDTPVKEAPPEIHKQATPFQNYMTQNYMEHKVDQISGITSPQSRRHSG